MNVSESTQPFKLFPMSGNQANPSFSMSSRAVPQPSHRQRDSSSSRRNGPHLNPFLGRGGDGAGGNNTNSDENDGTNSSARLMRQQFRKRCQEAMARDRQRDRARKLQRTRELGSSGPNSETDEASSSLHSEAYLDSELGDETEISMVDNNDEEAMRKVMTAEYRLLLQTKEHEGHLELGWLGADEIEWLNEEIRKEDMRRQNVEMEPPPGLEDEDEMLCDIYEHAQNQAKSSLMGIDPINQDDEDFSWVNDADLNWSDQDSMQN